MYIEWSYGVYLTLSIAITVWVAHALHSRGQIFLVDAFRGNEALAESVNHLLVIGFYLINIGFVTMALTSDRTLITLRHAIEFLSNKVGLVLLVLGAMHLFNLMILTRIRSNAIERCS